MSFLPLDELDPTLSDVLAFIDGFAGTIDGPSADEAAAIKRKKSRADASRRFQQKKKAELLALREQVTTLQKRLKQLQDNGNAGRRGGGRLDETQRQKVVATWLGRAEVEKHRRLQSEARNRQLKAVLARQKHTAKVIKHLVQNVTSVVHIEEGLRTPGPAVGLGCFVPSFNDAIYAELASRMSDMYLDADLVLSMGHHVKETRFITDVVEICWDPRTGVPYVELRATQSVNMSVQEAADMSRHAKAYDRSRYKKHDETELGLKKESEIKLHNSSKTMPINVMSLARMYDEDDRVLSMWTSLVCDHPMNATVMFREQGWVVVSASPLNPLQRSIIQVCYRLTPDMKPGLAYVPGRDADAVTVFVLQELGTHMRDNFQYMGNAYSNGRA
ncbi:uncharacterized protein IUM83_17665 [Phytophthora cinnamomi]|uniref:uncharacterized protein n=1 Tax=Phytophthora cinnamomi TaxID=4785 RepID=UPI00355ABE4E|nr:hypothetical protein IUM83_17665 [Phytophthora cinnamomi]